MDGLISSMSAPLRNINIMPWINFFPYDRQQPPARKKTNRGTVPVLTKLSMYNKRKQLFSTRQNTITQNRVIPLGEHVGAWWWGRNSIPMSRNGMIGRVGGTIVDFFSVI